MPSFDIVSEVNIQEADNAVNQAKREIESRYDFKGKKYSLEFDKAKQEVKHVLPLTVGHIYTSLL